MSEKCLIVLEQSVEAAEEAPHGWDACDILYDAVCAFAVLVKKVKLKPKFQPDLKSVKSF